MNLIVKLMQDVNKHFLKTVKNLLLIITISFSFCRQSPNILCIA